MCLKLPLPGVPIPEVANKAHNLILPPSPPPRVTRAVLERTKNFALHCVRLSRTLGRVGARARRSVLRSSGRASPIFVSVCRVAFRASFCFSGILRSSYGSRQQSCATFHSSKRGRETAFILGSYLLVAIRFAVSRLKIRCIASLDNL